MNKLAPLAEAAGDQHPATGVGVRPACSVASPSATSDAAHRHAAGRRPRCCWHLFEQLSGRQSHRCRRCRCGHRPPARSPVDSFNRRVVPPSADHVVRRRPLRVENGGILHGLRRFQLTQALCRSASPRFRDGSAPRCSRVRVGGAPLHRQHGVRPDTVSSHDVWRRDSQAGRPVCIQQFQRIGHQTQTRDAVVKANLVRHCGHGWPGLEAEEIFCAVGQRAVQQGCARRMRALVDEVAICRFRIGAMRAVESELDAGTARAIDDPDRRGRDLRKTNNGLFWPRIRREARAQTFCADKETVGNGRW